MRNILILGIGGSGAKVVASFSATRKNDERLSFLAIDSDVKAIKGIETIPTICLTENISLGNVIEKLNKESVSEWFPCDDSQGKVGFFKTLEMGRGANGWRMKGLLSFEYMLSDSEKRMAFLDVLDRLVNKDDPDGSMEIVLIGSLAGGTGSALFMPVAMYIKRYFRSKFNRDVTVKALLSCPDVYVDALTSENKVRAYANAYAALAELNAVDLVSKGYNESAKAKSKCAIGFKIGSERSKGIGVLFDADMTEFAVRSAQPFESVYLFDRIPGTVGIFAHEQKMTNILGIIVDDEIGKDSSEIYAGISVSEIVFASESIVDYVSKKKVFDDMEREWLSLYRSSQKDSAGTFTEDEIFEFAKQFTAYYKSLYTKKTYNQHLALNREKEEDGFVPEVDYKEPVISVEYVSEYISALIDGFYAYFDSDDAMKIKLAFKDKDEDIHSVKFFDTKSAKVKKLTALINKAAGYHDTLLGYFRAGAKLVKESKDKIEAMLLDRNNEKSLVRNLIIYNGKYLHPVTALLLLSDAYIEIKNCLQAMGMNSAYGEPYDGKELPDFVFRYADLSQDVHEEYIRLGSARLKEVATANPEKLSPKLLEAFPAIKQDLHDIYTSVTKKFVACLLDRTRLVVSELIKNYRSVLDNVPKILADHKVDIKLALIANTSNTCTLMNVGCTEEIKQEAYVRYRKEKENDYSRDEYSGKIFFEYTSREDRDNLFDALVEEEKKNILSGSVVKNACGQDIFRVLHDRDIFKDELPEKTAYNDFKQAFAMAALPLDLALEVPEDYAKIETVTIVPVAAAEFARERMKEEDLSLQQATEKYLFAQGDFETNFAISDSILRNRIFITQKIHGFPLHLVNKLNEKNESAVYYKNYRKALCVKREQDSQMWNPHLVRETVGSFLPFINPVKREAFEKNVYKAVFYMLKNGVFLVEENEGHHDIFYYMDRECREEVLFENKPVSYKTPELLLGFVRENVELAERYGEAFNAELEKEIFLLPVIGFEKTDIPRMRQTIWSGKILKFFRNDLMANVRSAKALEPKGLVDFIFSASEKEVTASEAVGLGRTISSVISELVHGRQLSEDDLYDQLYQEIIGALRSECEQKAQNTDQRSYIKKIERVFSLIDTEE